MYLTFILNENKSINEDIQTYHKSILPILQKMKFMFFEEY